MVTFIDENNKRWGVEPIRRVLPIASSTYYGQCDDICKVLLVVVTRASNGTNVFRSLCGGLQ
jgi:hypothetical protein